MQNAKMVLWSGYPIIKLIRLGRPLGIAVGITIHKYMDIQRNTLALELGRVAALKKKVITYNYIAAMCVHLCYAMHCVKDLCEFVDFRDVVDIYWLTCQYMLMIHICVILV